MARKPETDETDGEAHELTDEDIFLLDQGIHPSGEKMRPGDIRPDTGEKWDPFARPDAEVT